MANGACIRVALSNNSGVWYKVPKLIVIITKCHLKIIPLTFGAIFLEEKKWPDSTYITVAPKLQ